MKIILLPGWNEGAEAMRIFVDGRNGIPGLRQRGYDCAVFDGGQGSLRERIARFGEFLVELKRTQPEAFPIAAFGYCAGGLVTRGFQRGYPQSAGEIRATFQLAAPNAGVVTDEVASFLRAMRVSNDVIEDMDIDSEFMRWLNGTGGHWEGEGGAKRWMLDRAPWVAPEGAAIHNLIGLMPRYHNRSDGVVPAESGTLCGHMPHETFVDKSANHLNLSGAWNPLTLVVRGWRADDTVWPAVVGAADAFFRLHLPNLASVPP